ncbi:hypothetical protein [Hymenobacter sp. B81]|uniref:hypothetical protein n=1 Tax=Hymenobacter sp. B81 TaxID=3344878 RepID=UPI0037DDC37B
MAEDATVLLRIQIDSDAYHKQLQQLTLDIEKNKLAQQELTRARKAHTLTDEEFSQRSVELAAELKRQRGEYAALQKDLALYNSAVAGTGTSYKEVQSALSLAQRQFQQLEGSADNNTEATKALSEVIDGYRQRLTQTDAAQSAYFRQIGNYPKLSADAQQSLESLAIELEKLRKAQAESAKAGGPVSPEATQRVQELESALAQAHLANTEYGNSVIDLKRKLADLTTARDLSQDKEAVNELNAAILEVKGALQEARGVTDEFGDRIEKNAKKEELATLGDAFGGVTAAIQLSTLAMVDQEDAERATAVATTILAQAEAARNLQIGLASARDAGHIILLKAKNLLFTEGATATAAHTAATTAGAAAATAQTAATGGATLAQRALNLAMKLNPIGLVVVAVGALVGAYYAWRGASEKTKREVADLMEKVLRFGTPIGLVVTGLQKLYEKSETVRKVLDPLGRLFDTVAGKALSAAREAGEAVGLLDTATEKAIKAQERRVENQKKQLEAADLIAGKYKEEARAAELAGEALEKSRALERKGLAKQLEEAKEYVARLTELRRRRKEDGQAFTDEETKTLQEYQLKTQELQNNLLDFDLQTRDKLAAARKKELDATKSDAEKARKLAEQRLKDEYATRKQLLDNRQQQIARLLEVVEKGSEDEQRLLREQVRNATNIQLAENSAAQVGAAKKQQQALTAARAELMANGNAQLAQLERQFTRQRILDVFDLTAKGNETLLAQVQEHTDEETRLRQQAIATQLGQELAAIDRRESAEKQAAQEALLRATAAKELADLEYADSLRRLENFLAEKRQALERDHATGALSEEQYQRTLAAFEQSALQARIVVNQDYQRDTVELTRQKVDAQLREESRLTEQTRDALKDRLDAAADFGQQVGDVFADSMQQQGRELESFAAGFILLVVDVLQRQVQATLAAAIFNSTAASMASPESVATAGAAGVLKAALLNAAIAAAFGVFKGAIRSSFAAPSDSKFAGGTVLGGAPHSQGGTQLFAPGGQHWGEAEQYEMVLTKNVFLTPGLREAANALNLAAGGKNLLAGLPGGGAWPTRMDLGRLLAPPSIVRDYLRAGYLPGTGSMLAAPPASAREVGQEVAEALKGVKIVTRVTDIKDGLSRDAFTAQLGGD